MHLFLGFLESHHGHRGLTEHYGKKTGNNVADSHADSAVDGRGIAHGIRNAKDKVFEGKTDDRFCHDVHKGSDQAKSTPRPKVAEAFSLAENRCFPASATAHPRRNFARNVGGADVV